MTSAEAPRLPRLLLIDDDAVSREVMAMVLEVEGFPVALAEDGAEALAYVAGAGAETEVILMDTQMPGLSGLELVRALRAATGARIIAISGSPAGEAIQQATDGFLLKPFEAAELVCLLDSQGRMTGPGAVKADGDPALPIGDAIDAAVLGKLRSMMPEAAVQELYAAVAADLEKRLVTLQGAMDSGDTEEVQKIGHAIKGGCAMVGLLSATAAASRLETSNLRETWQKEHLQIKDALIMLQSILCDRLL